MGAWDTHAYFHAAIKISFGEIDYREYEHKEGIEITVQLMGINEGDIPITVQTLTYDQVEEQKWPISGEDLPDPAECETEYCTSNN